MKRYVTAEYLNTTLTLVGMNIRLWALDIGMLWATIPAEGRAYIGIWDTLTIMDLNPEELVL